jgi:hypothetical protein
MTDLCSVEIGTSVTHSNLSRHCARAEKEEEEAEEGEPAKKKPDTSLALSHLFPKQNGQG